MSQFITPIRHVDGIHSDIDRRSSPRFATSIQAILRFQDRLQSIQGNVCDISIGGAGFICRQAVAANSKCTLQFELPAFDPGRNRSVTVQVMVVNSMQVVGQASQFRINLRFIALPPSVRSQIETFIQRSLSQA